MYHYLFPFEKVTQSSHIVLYGAGNVGKDFYNQVTETNFCKIVLWLDKNADGNIVKLPETIASLNADNYDAVIIAIESEIIANNVKNFLKDYGVPENKILHKVHCKKYKISLPTCLSQTEKAKLIGKYWSNVHSSKSQIKSNWWDHEIAIRHINMLVASVDSPIFSEGLNQLLIKRLNGKRLQTGVSVGCGIAHKEMRLLQLGIVEKFILFELAEDVVNIALKKAKELNLENRIEFRIGDAFEYDFSNTKIDLVHWNNSLHHMFDVQSAVKWSYNILCPGGVFYMDDYVGANRFQYPHNVLEIANTVRCALLDDFGAIMANINPDSIDDPSEAVDSENILESVLKYFPQAEVKRTGGIIYLIVMGGNIWSSFDGKQLPLLTLLLKIDEMLAMRSDIMSPYAVALAVK